MAKYLNDLDAATSASASDLMLIEESGVDKKITYQNLTSDLVKISGSTMSGVLTSVDILPEMTGASGSVSVRNIGSDTARYANVWADEVHVGSSSLYVNGKKVIEDISDVITFATDIDQAIQIKTSSTTPGTGNGNVTIQSSNEAYLTGQGNITIQSSKVVSVSGQGGIDFTVSGAAGKNILFTNSSSGGLIQFSGNANFLNDLEIVGDLTVNGTTTTIDTTTVNIEDNLIQINSNQTGTPSTNLIGGIDVNRGDETDYRFIFAELTDTFRIGMNGSEQAVATREDSPVSEAVPFWNDTAKRLDTSSDLTFDGDDLKVKSVRVVTATSGTSFPGSPGFGDECYRSDLDEWYKYNGSAWIQI